MSISAQAVNLRALSAPAIPPPLALLWRVEAKMMFRARCKYAVAAAQFSSSPANSDAGEIKYVKIMMEPTRKHRASCKSQADGQQKLWTCVGWSTPSALDRGHTTTAQRSRMQTETSPSRLVSVCGQTAWEATRSAVALHNWKTAVLQNQLRCNTSFLLSEVV